jgi:mannitol/fructose-specific phosphotransferase system IIA component (Ntr-type)
MLSVDQILDNMRATDHFDALEELVDHLAVTGHLRGVETSAAMQAIRDREEQTSTGIGSGVAIPHAFIPGLESMVTIFGRSRNGIDFEAIDHAPVTLLFLLLVPENGFQQHLEALAEIARMLNNGETRARLTDAGDPDAIRRILEEHLDAQTGSA